MERRVLGVVEERVSHRVGPLVGFLRDLPASFSFSRSSFFFRRRRRAQGVEERQGLAERVQLGAQLPGEQRRGVAAAPRRGVGRERRVAAKVGRDARHDRGPKVGDRRGQAFSFFSSSFSFSSRGGDGVRPAPGAVPRLQHGDADAAAGQVEGRAEAGGPGADDDGRRAGAAQRGGLLDFLFFLLFLFFLFLLFFLEDDGLPGQEALHAGAQQLLPLGEIHAAKLRFQLFPQELLRRRGHVGGGELGSQRGEEGRVGGNRRSVRRRSRSRSRRRGLFLPLLSSPRSDEAEVDRSDQREVPVRLFDELGLFCCGRRRRTRRRRIGSSSSSSDAGLGGELDGRVGGPEGEDERAGNVFFEWGRGRGVERDVRSLLLWRRSKQVPLSHFTRTNIAPNSPRLQVL